MTAKYSRHWTADKGQDLFKPVEGTRPIMPRYCSCTADEPPTLQAAQLTNGDKTWHAGMYIPEAGEIEWHCLRCFATKPVSGPGIQQRSDVAPCSLPTFR